MLIILNSLPGEQAFQAGPLDHNPFAYGVPGAGA
jgi:hypothetical protein